jgi:tetratricopeptide (TPR) repeat protein
MKWKPFLIFLMVSCQSSPEPNQEEITDKFNQSWQSDSIPKVLALRQELAKIAPGKPEGLYSKAWLADRNGDLKKALKTADSLVMGFPQFEKGLYLRANLKDKSGDTQGAIEDFGKALKKNPGFFEALINRGSIHFKTKHYDLALKDFQSAEGLYPKNKLVCFNLGNVWLAYAKPEKACPYWQKADSLGMPGAYSLFKKYCQL